MICCGKEVKKMGRLIDADDAINVFTNRLFETLKTNLPCVTAEENQICLETCYKVAKYEIDTIPTAYDVKKVVADLQALKTKYKQLQRVTEDKFVVHELEMRCLQIDKDIEIVKAGGING